MTLWFGTSAKLIENKIHVNVTDAQNSDEIKNIIADYESWIREYEQDKNWTANLLKTIEDLKEEKQILNNWL